MYIVISMFYRVTERRHLLQILSGLNFSGAFISAKKLTLVSFLVTSYLTLIFEQSFFLIIVFSQPLLYDR